MFANRIVSILFRTALSVYVSFCFWTDGILLQFHYALLKALDKVLEEDKNVYLVRLRRPFQLIAEDLRKYVQDYIDVERIQAVIKEGYEKGYANNPKRKKEIQQERLNLAKNGLKEFCESKPELAAKLNQ